MEQESFEKNGAKCTIFYGVNNIASSPFNNNHTDFKFKFEELSIVKDQRPYAYPTSISIGKKFNITSSIYIEKNNIFSSYQSLTHIEPYLGVHKYELYQFITLKHLEKHIDILHNNNIFIDKNVLKSKLDICFKKFWYHE